MFNNLFQSYNDFHVDEIQTNRFQPEYFNEVLDRFSAGLEVRTLGESIEGRPLRQLRLGSGPLKVLMWSQMHGNESTATRALLDLLKFHQEPGEFKAAWQAILEKVTLYIIPIVNPDGTARFKRRNALDLDLNRDARAGECPESRILQAAMKDIAPDFSFNLHDQRRFYNISGTAKPSTISFLAPAYEVTESVNEGRLAAMQLIAAMRQDLESVIPGQIGLYDDSFAPRAFGDYSQALGSSTILIEAGWQQYDMEKEFVRQLNFTLLVSALQSIAEQSFKAYTEEDYRRIPMNDEKLFDVLLRNVMVVINKKQLKIDIGILREEITVKGSGNYFSVGTTVDIGDLREWYGFEEVDGHDLMVVDGKIADLSVREWQELEEAEQIALIKAGNLFLVNELADPSDQNSAEKINFLRKEAVVPGLAFEKPANFLLINKAGELKYIVLNGFLWPIDEAPPERLNGLVLS